MGGPYLIYSHQYFCFILLLDFKTLKILYEDVFITYIDNQEYSNFFPNYFLKPRFFSKFHGWVTFSFSLVFFFNKEKGNNRLLRRRIQSLWKKWNGLTIAKKVPTVRKMIVIFIYTTKLSFSFWWKFKINSAWFGNDMDCFKFNLITPKSGKNSLFLPLFVCYSLKT